MTLDSHGKPVSLEFLKAAKALSIFIQFCLPWRKTAFLSKSSSL